MLNEKNEVICYYPRDCGKPATRILRYYVDPPNAIASEPKREPFCDKHAEAEMQTLQKPGLFFFGSGATREDGIVHELSNQSIEDYCIHHFTEDRKVVVRVGRNVDPTVLGYAPEQRGKTLVLDADAATSEVHIRRRVKKVPQTKNKIAINSTRGRVSLK